MKKLSQLLLDQIEWFIKRCEEQHLTNEQFYLDFEDNLNLLSIKDHNQKGG